MDIERAVKDKYGALADAVKTGGGNCCGADACGCGGPIGASLYTDEQTADLPSAATQVSLGCGNPTALAELRAGEVVLDLGSGGGLDVLLSAKRVGPTGKVFGLDMTDQMLALARENQRKAGATNVEFLEGTIEAIPLPDNSVDVIISNCVINLAADKDAVFRESFRVLKPGGRLAVSDIVVRGHVPEAERADLERWTGCMAGALEARDYIARLQRAGFTETTVETSAPLHEDGQFASAFIRATKPHVRSCCGPTCCS